MKFRTFFAVLALLAAVVSATGKTIRADRKPLSEVLKQIDQASDSVSVSFVYATLEDYPVTETISTDNIVNAVFKAVGLYPVKVSMLEGGKIIVVEPRISSGRKVTGRVVDETGQPLEYATVRFFSTTDSTYLGSGVTNRAGDFVVPINSSSARMTVTALGYLPLTQTVSPGNIGSIRVRSNPIELKAVTVKAQYVMSEGGKLTARPTPTQVKHSHDIYTLLGQMPLPGLYVDPVMRSIQAYRESPIILIDGVERGGNDLLSIRPNNVSRIEYITDIPAKYISRRPPVVINIILKEPQEGGNAWANARSAVNTGFVDAGGGMSYNQGKSEFSANYNYSYRDYNERIIDERTSYIAPDTRIDIESKGRKSPFDYNTNDGQVKYTYRDSETAYLSARVNFNKSVRHANENADVHDSYRGDYARHSQIRNSNFSVRPDIYFQKDWKENGKLEIQTAGNISDMDYTRNLTDTVNGVPVVSYPSNLRTSVRSIKVESSYERSFGKFNLNLGYRFNYSRSKNNYTLDHYVQCLRTSTNSVYGGVNTNIAGLYTSLSGSVGFVNYPGEEKYSQIKKPTVNLSLYLWKKLTNTVDANISGSYWTIRPSLSQVTDFQQRYDGYLLSAGNPDLRMQKSYDLSPSVRWQIPGFWTRLRVNWQQNWRPIYTTVIYLGNGEFMTKPVNGEHNYELTPDISAGVNQILNGHLSAQINYSYRHYRYVCQDGVYTLNAPDWFFSVTGYLNDWQCQFSVSHPGRYLYGPTVSRGENHNAFMISRTFGSHWHAYAAIMYFLKNEGTVYPSSEKLAHRVQQSVTNIRDNHAMIVLGVSYSGSFGRIFKTGSRSLNGGASGGDYKVVQ